MKKILAFVALSLFVASAAFGAATVAMDSSLTATTAKTGYSLYGDVTTATTSTPLIGKTSTGVALAAKTASNGYAMCTQHKSGNRAFGTAYDSTSVFYQETTNIGTPIHGTVSATDSSEFAGWTSM